MAGVNGLVAAEFTRVLASVTAVPNEKEPVLKSGAGCTELWVNDDTELPDEPADPREVCAVEPGRDPKNRAASVSTAGARAAVEVDPLPKEVGKGLAVGKVDVGVVVCTVLEPN